MDLPFAESYKIKMVEPVFRSTRLEREKWIREASFNLFNLRSDQVFIDLLTDSGTSAMSQTQWAAIMTGDESYAGSRSFQQLKESITRITGFPYILPTHQGRAAENVLFSAIIKKGDLIPGNAHFDTTKGHIEFREAFALDCTIAEANDIHSDFPFKGNVDIQKLEEVIKVHKDHIPLIIVTITCNTAGGQPVSMQNLKAVSGLAKHYGIPLFLDSARFAENAWFIKIREEGFHDRSIQEIVNEIFSYADGMTMSAKKDGIVNIGGFIALRDNELYKKACTFNIMFEGFTTYGGMAGRDMAALAVGLNEVLEEDFLYDRINQVKGLWEKIKSFQIPVQNPAGGHAVFVDALKFLPHVPREEFPAQTLAIELYVESGVRAVEIGTLMADRDPVTGENRFPQNEFVRLAIPRRVYTDNHMNYVAHALKNVFNKRDSIRSGYEIIDEAPILRHFSIQLRRK
jgi:tryptophanase